MEFWMTTLNEQIHELEFALMTEWQTFSQHVVLFCCITIQPWIWSIRGIALNSGWLYIPCCESRYYPPVSSENKGEFSVGFKTNTVGRWERLEHHMGHAGFPNSHCGAVVCVEAILDCTQTASSDWWAQGMFTPAQRYKRFFLFRTQLVQFGEIMWGMNRSQSLKWYTVNWHSALESKSNASVAFYVDVVIIFFWTCFFKKGLFGRCGVKRYNH